MNTMQRKAEAAANHKANLSASIKRRMEVARTNNDAGLLNVLEQEMKQLGLNQKRGALRALLLLGKYLSIVKKAEYVSSALRTIHTLPFYCKQLISTAKDFNICK